MYTIILTHAEYRDAEFMTVRGYLGELLDHATEEDWTEDGATVTLRFRESDAWAVLTVCEDDPEAIWALTSPSTSLGAKFAAFLDAIV